MKYKLSKVYAHPAKVGTINRSSGKLEWKIRGWEVIETFAAEEIELKNQSDVIDYLFEKRMVGGLEKIELALRADLNDDFGVFVILPSTREDEDDNEYTLFPIFYIEKCE